ncbi:hypothetical protein AHiyo1_26950 [Arthrobacter sp. Hiyo1]|nr:hypothetical protein AHiyo1_26950 [Arthrobacter sp. Hiyo1]
MSVTGCMVPISLLASIIDTRLVLGLIASAMSLGETIPCASTGRKVTSPPRF